MGHRNARFKGLTHYRINARPSQPTNTKTNSINPSNALTNIFRRCSSACYLISRSHDCGA